MRSSPAITLIWVVMDRRSNLPRSRRKAGLISASPTAAGGYRRRSSRLGAADHGLGPALYRRLPRCLRKREIIDAGKVSVLHGRIAYTRYAWRRSVETTSPEIFEGRVMTPADLERVHKEIRGFERIEAVSDEMRTLIEELWPELVHKLPPKEHQ